MPDPDFAASCAATEPDPNFAALSLKDASWIVWGVLQRAKAEGREEFAGYAAAVHRLLCELRCMEEEPGEFPA